MNRRFFIFIVWHKNDYVCFFKLIQHYFNGETSIIQNFSHRHRFLTAFATVPLEIHNRKHQKRNGIPPGWLSCHKKRQTCIDNQHELYMFVCHLQWTIFSCLYWGSWRCIWIWTCRRRKFCTPIRRSNIENTWREKEFRLYIPSRDAAFEYKRVDGKKFARLKNIENTRWETECRLDDSHVTITADIN